MSIFWKNFYFLCEDRETRPLRVVTELGIASGSITKWKKGAIPSAKNLQKLADYFNVTSECFFVDHEKVFYGFSTDHTDDELWKKICRLTEDNRKRVDGYVSAVLEEQNQQEIAKIKKA